MVWYYGKEKPQEVEIKLRLGQRQRTVAFNIEEINEGGYKYRWQSVTLEPGVWGYDPLVSAIVTARYPYDVMQAIINNYLITPRTEQADAEMKAMQEWRLFAKEIAHKVTESV